VIVICGHVSAQEVGFASYYHEYFNGKKTANGEIYNDAKMTAAHKTLPLGTIIKVTNLENNRSIVVRVNDRGPYVKDRILDLTKSGAIALGYLNKGTARVTYEIVNGRETTPVIAQPDTVHIDTRPNLYYEISQPDTAESMGYGIKVASYEDAQQLLTISRDIQIKYKIKSYIQVVSLLKGNLYRIFAGNYKSTEEAEEARKQLKATFPNCYVIQYEKFK
jgi:rare lipoprotein A